MVASAKLNNNTSLVAGVESGEVAFLAHVHNPEIVGHPVDHFVLLDSVNIADNTFGAYSFMHSSVSSRAVSLAFGGAI